MRKGFMGMGTMAIGTIAAAASLLSGCATQARYKEKLNSWVGVSAQSLVESWGYPASQLSSPSGNTVYVYQSSGGFNMPVTSTTNAAVTGYGNTAYGTATTTTTGGQFIAMNCTTYFEISRDQRVISWRYQGNNCVSR